MSNVNLFLVQYEFFPGNIVSGKAVCNFKSSKDVRKVNIRLKGEESTQWLSRERYYDNRTKKHEDRSVRYHGNRDFLLRDHLVHGEGTMGVGEHVFPFEFPLPEDLPSSFAHHYGKIQYSVKVTVDRSWNSRKPDYDCEKEIIIISPIKLQTFSLSLLQPAQYSDEKTVCCLCCASGPIQLDVSLEKRAFIVGEYATIKVNCSNMSNVNVESIKAEIKLRLTFMANRPLTTNNYKSDTELVVTSPNSGVGAHGDKTFNLNLQIPPSTVVPNFRGCEFFSCDSVLQVSAAMSGCHTDLAITTEVALGHIPFLQEQPVTLQYMESVPPYPANEIQPMPMPMPMPMSISMPMPMPMPMPMSMPMPMPMPGYEPEAVKAAGLPSYPGLVDSQGPSAPKEIGGPSAPSKLSFDGNPTDLGAGKSSGYEAPPPTYDEASKDFK